MPYVVLPEDSFRIGSCCRRLVGRRIRRKVHLAPEEAVGSSSHRFVEETAVVAAVAAVFDVADTAVAAAFAVGIAVAAETLAVVVGAATEPATTTVAGRAVGMETVAAAPG